MSLKATVRCVVSYVLLLSLLGEGDGRTLRLAYLGFAHELNHGVDEFSEGFLETFIPELRSPKVAPRSDGSGGFVRLDASGSLTHRWDVDAVSYFISSTDYQTMETEIEAALSLMAAGQNQARDPVGAIDALIVGTSRANQLVMRQAERYGLPNIHCSGGNPKIWTTAEPSSFGMHAAFTLDSRSAIHAAATHGIKTIAVVRSADSDFLRLSAMASLTWARESHLRVVGPSAKWCQKWQNFTRTCRLENGRCLCGKQSEVIGEVILGKDPPSAVPGGGGTFYEAADELIAPPGFDLSSSEIILAVEAFGLGVIEDIREQGYAPGIFMNLVQSHRSILSAMVKADFVPQSPVGSMVIGFPEDESSTWRGADTRDATDEMILDGTHATWSVYGGQWHESLRLRDAVFRSNADFVELFTRKFFKVPSADAASCAAAGSILYIAIEKYIDPDGLAHGDAATRRAAIKTALGEVSDETVFGVTRFSRSGLNVGRDPITWQSFPEGREVVMPISISTRPIQLDFGTWDSRLGCPPGTHNTGTKCRPCSPGSFSDHRSIGMVATTCETCPQGKGTAAAKSGAVACDLCPEGSVQGSVFSTSLLEVKLNGICSECPTGTFFEIEEAPSGNTSMCRMCQPGKYQDRLGQTSCNSCPRGSFSSLHATVQCTACFPGSWGQASGQSQCSDCPSYQGFKLQCNGSDTLPVSSPGTYLLRPVEPVAATPSDWHVVFASCPRTEACLGENRCLEGHIGVLCASCKCSQDKCYIMSHKSGLCEVCPDNASSLVTAFAAVVIYFVFWIFLVRRLLAVGHAQVTAHSGFLKIMLYHYQFSTILFEVIYADFVAEDFWGLSFTRSALSILGGSAGGPWWTAAECLLFPILHLRAPFLQVLVGLCTPLFIGIVLLLFGALSITSWSRGRITLISWAIAWSYVVHPTVTSLLLTVFECQEAPGEGNTLRSRFYYDMECDSDEMFSWMLVSVVGSLLFTLGAPAFYAAFLKYQKRRCGSLYTAQTKVMGGFLFKGYEHDLYFWESINVIRRTILTLTKVIPWHAARVYFLLMVGLVSIGVQGTFMPHLNYDGDAVDRTEQAMLRVFVIVSSLYSLWYLSVHITPDADSLPFQAIIYLAGFVFECYFLGLLAWNLALPLVRSFAQKKKVEYPCLERFCPHMVTFNGDTIYIGELGGRERKFFISFVCETIHRVFDEFSRKATLRTEDIACCLHMAASLVKYLQKKTSEEKNQISPSVFSIKGLQVFSASFQNQSILQDDQDNEILRAVRDPGPLHVVCHLNELYAGLLQLFDRSCLRNELLERLGDPVMFSRFNACSSGSSFASDSDAIRSRGRGLQMPSSDLVSEAPPPSSSGDFKYWPSTVGGPLTPPAPPPHLDKSLSDVECRPMKAIMMCRRKCQDCDSPTPGTSHAVIHPSQLMLEQRKSTFSASAARHEVGLQTHFDDVRSLSWEYRECVRWAFLARLLLDRHHRGAEDLHAFLGRVHRKDLQLARRRAGGLARHLQTQAERIESQNEQLTQLLRRNEALEEMIELRTKQKESLALALDRSRQELAELALACQQAKLTASAPSALASSARLPAPYAGMGAEPRAWASEHAAGNDDEASRWFIDLGT